MASGGIWVALCAKSATVGRPPGPENAPADFPPLAEVGEPVADGLPIDAEMNRSGFLHTPGAPVLSDEGEKKCK